MKSSGSVWKYPTCANLLNSQPQIQKVHLQSHRLQGLFAHGQGHDRSQYDTRRDRHGRVDERGRGAGGTAQAESCGCDVPAVALWQRGAESAGRGDVLFQEETPTMCRVGAVILFRFDHIDIVVGNALQGGGLVSAESSGWGPQALLRPFYGAALPRLCHDLLGYCNRSPASK